LEKDFIGSQTEIQAISKEKNKLKETMGKKLSELEALNAEKDKRIESLDDELKWAKEEYEAEVNKIRQTSTETAVNLSAASSEDGRP
jgi:restriction endonuclease S subunit